MNRYFKPRSVSWWASFVPLFAGIIVASEPIHGLSSITDTINARIELRHTKFEDLDIGQTDLDVSDTRIMVGFSIKLN